MAEPPPNPYWDDLVVLSRTHPHAMVGVSTPSGERMPAAPPEIRELFANGFPPGEALEHVRPEDHGIVVALWVGARSNGYARGQVRLAQDPKNSMDYYIFDLTESHGVVASVAIEPGEGEHPLPSSEPVPVRSRRMELTCNPAGAVQSVGPTVSGMLGYSPESFVGTALVDLIHPEDVDETLVRWVELMSAEGNQAQGPVQFRNREGGWVYCEATFTNRLGSQGDIFGELLDISEEMEAQSQLRQREDLLQRLTSALPTGIAHFDRDRSLIFSNSQLHGILGSEPTSLDQYLERIDPADLSAATELVDQATQEACDGDLEITIVNAKSEEQRRCRLSLRALVDHMGEPLGVLCCLDDFTDNWRLQQLLEAQATTDDLTKVANRNAVCVALNEALTDEGKETSAGVFYFDLNGFKEINDRFGHNVGDAVLCDVSARLEAVCRPSDLVGRLGGDEFIVVASDISADEADGLAERFVEAISGSRNLGGIKVKIGVSCGYSLAPHREGISGEELIAQADSAMYHQKRAGDPKPKRFAA